MIETMQAVVCHEFGPIEQLVVESLPIPIPKSDEVLIKIEAAGVNFPDGLLVQGLYQMKPEHPFIPGNEVAGTIMQVGESVPYLQVGRRVVGLSILGGYAQYVCCKATHVMPLPDAVSFAQGAALVTAHATAHHGLKQRAALQPKEVVLVTGAAGGTGVAAIQIAKKMGAIVIAACSSQDKIDFAISQGADYGINYTTDKIKDQVNILTNNKGVDVVYDAVGGDYAEPAVRALAWKGRYLVVGFPAGIPKIPLNLTLLKGCQIVGVFWGAHTVREPQNHAENLSDLFTLYSEGKVKPRISASYALEDAGEALKLLQDRKVLGKVVVTMP